MIGFMSGLFGFDWLALAGWIGAAVMAAGAVWAFVALPTARWAWKALGVGAFMLVLLMLWRAEIRKAEARGYDRAMVEASIAAAAASKAWQAQVDDTAADLAAARAANRTKGRKVQTDVAQFYRENPGAAGVRCLSDERVRAANRNRAGLYPAAPGGSGHTVPDRADPVATDG